MSASTCRMMKALTAIRRALTSASTGSTSLGWGAPRKLNSQRSSPATRTLLAGGTGYASSPSRKAAPSITCAVAGGFEISTSLSASQRTHACRVFSAVWSSPGIGVPLSSGAARMTRRNTPAVLSMSPSGSSRTAPALSPGCESGWTDGQQDTSIPSESPTSHTSQSSSSTPTLDQSPGTRARLLRPGPKQQGIASRMAWCLSEALRLTHDRLLMASRLLPVRPELDRTTRSAWL